MRSLSLEGSRQTAFLLDDALQAGCPCRATDRQGETVQAAGHAMGENQAEYASIVALVFMFILIKSVHTA